MAAGTKERTVAEIEKAIQDREEQNLKDKEELVKAKAREALAKVENDIFFYLDDIRKNLDTLPESLKLFFSEHCKNYNDSFALLRKKFRADVNELSHKCVVECLTSFMDGMKTDGQTFTADDFLKRLEKAFPKIASDLKAFKAEKARRAESAKAKRVGKKQENAAPQTQTTVTVEG